MNEKKNLFITAILVLSIFNIIACSKEKETETIAKRVAPPYSKLWEQAGFGDEITTIAFSPNGEVLATGTNSYDRYIRLHNPDNGKLVKSIPASNKWNLIFSTDGNSLIGNGRKDIVFWDVSTWEVKNRLDSQSSSLRAIAQSPVGDAIASGGLDSTVSLWDTATLNSTNTITIKGWCWIAEYSPDGKYLIVGGNPDIQLIDLASNQIVSTMKGYETGLKSNANIDTFAVNFTPDSKRLITGGLDTILRIWEVPTGKLLKQFDKQESVIQVIKVTPNGNTLILGTVFDIRFYDLNTGNLIKVLTDVRNTTAMQISPDGKTLVAGSDKVLRSWRLPD